MWLLRRPAGRLVILLVALVFAGIFFWSGGPRRAQYAECPKCLGTLERIENPRPEWVPSYRGPVKTGPEPASELTQRMERVLRQQPGMVAKYSPDAMHALLYPRDSGAGDVPVWVVSRSGEEHFIVQLPPALGLDAFWSPNSQHAVVFHDVVYLSREMKGLPRRLTFACLSLTGKAPAQVRVVRGPGGSRYWAPQCFDTEGSTLFVTSPQAGRFHDKDRGQLWIVAVPDGKWSLLYTQPHPQWPPRVQERIDREGWISRNVLKGAEPAMGKQRYTRWGALRLSPSGELLLFRSYPPDNYMSDVLWVANVRTGQLCEVPLGSDDRNRYCSPLEWQDDGRPFVFAARLGGPGPCYVFTLAPGIWEEEPRGADESQ